MCVCGVRNSALSNWGIEKRYFGVKILKLLFLRIYRSRSAFARASFGRGWELGLCVRGGKLPHTFVWLHSFNFVSLYFVDVCNGRFRFIFVMEYFFELKLFRKDNYDRTITTIELLEIIIFFLSQPSYYCNRKNI